MGKKSQKALNLDTLQDTSTKIANDTVDQFNLVRNQLTSFRDASAIFSSSKPSKPTKLDKIVTHMHELEKRLFKLQTHHLQLVKHVTESSLTSATATTTSSSTPQKVTREQSVQTDSPLHLDALTQTETPPFHHVKIQTDPALNHQHQPAPMELDDSSDTEPAPSQVQHAATVSASSTVTTPPPTVPQQAPARPPRRPKQDPAPRKVARSVRLFQDLDHNVPNGFTYVYFPWSGRHVSRAQIRFHLRNAASIDTSRILDICFPARGTIGLLIHAQYTATLTELFRAKSIKPRGPGFDPLDPKHLLDPKYAGLPDADRAAAAKQVHRTRCLAALRRLRVELLPAVAHSFVRNGWIDEKKDLPPLLEKHTTETAASKKRKLSDLFGTSSADNGDNASALSA